MPTHGIRGKFADVYPLVKAAWKDSRGNTQLSAIWEYPFDAEKEPCKRWLYRMIYGSEYRVRSLEPHNMDPNYYLNKLKDPANPFFEDTSTIIKKIIVYFDRKNRQNIFTRENKSQLRFIIPAYFAEHLSTLASTQTNSMQIEAYMMELKFVEAILALRQLFPTSTKDKGQQGFHTLLFAISKTIQSLSAISTQHAERLSLQVHITNLSTACHTYVFQVLEIMPYILSNIPFTKGFFLKDFKENEMEYKIFRSSIPGRWLAKICELDASKLLDEMEKENENTINIWLTAPDQQVEQLEKDSAIAERFKKNKSTLNTYVKLWGILFELIMLSRLLKYLGKCASMLGDFTLIFNQSLFNAVKNSLLFWESQSSICREALQEIQGISRGQTALNVTCQETWRINADVFSKFYTPFSTSDVNYKELISKIVEKTLSLRNKGPLTCSKQVKKLQKYVQNYSTRQIKLQTVGENKVERIEALAFLSETPPPRLRHRLLTLPEYENTALLAPINNNHTNFQTITLNSMEVIEQYQTTALDIVKAKNRGKEIQIQALLEEKNHPGQKLEELTHITFQLERYQCGTQTLNHYIHENVKLASKLAIIPAFYDLNLWLIYLSQQIKLLREINSALYLCENFPNLLELSQNEPELQPYQSLIHDYINYHTSLRWTAELQSESEMLDEKKVEKHRKNLQNQAPSRLQEKLPAILQKFIQQRLQFIFTQEDIVKNVTQNEKQLNDARANASKKNNPKGLTGFSDLFKKYKELCEFKFPPLPEGNSALAVEKLNAAYSHQTLASPRPLIEKALIHLNWVSSCISVDSPRWHLMSPLFEYAKTLFEEIRHQPSTYQGKRLQKVMLLLLLIKDIAAAEEPLEKMVETYETKTLSKIKNPVKMTLLSSRSEFVLFRWFRTPTTAKLLTELKNKISAEKISSPIIPTMS